ncbi:MAG: hypothetical protein U5J83_15085 [Bryobacterales bacterium]|nr:hypothetical protein [Bryobacterales bacterium]
MTERPITPSSTLETEPSPFDAGEHKQSAPETTSSSLAGELLDAVESGCSASLLEALSRIALIDTGGFAPAHGPAEDAAEREKLELLRSLAVQMRLDLHAMLMHIYQRIEASRGYLEVARHIAGRAPGSGSDLSKALPRLGLNRGSDDRGRTGHLPLADGQEFAAGEGNGEN